MNYLYKITQKSVFILIVLVCFVTVASIQSAHAFATIQLSDGTITFDVEDGSALDSNSASGAVTYVGAVGTDWWLNITTGLTYPTLGSAGSPQMDLSDISMTSYGVLSLTILFSQDNFSLSPAEFISSASVTTDGTAIFNTYYDNGNTLFALTQSVGTIGAFVASGPDESL